MIIPAEIVEPVLVGADAGHLAVVLDVTHGWSRAELEGAVAKLVATFPVLGCRYEKAFWRDRWVPFDMPPGKTVTITSVDGDLEAATREAVSRPPAPAVEWPFRVAQLEHPGGTRVLFVAAHLVGDGAGVGTAAAAFVAHLAGVPTPPAGDRSLVRLVGRAALRNLSGALADLVLEFQRTLAAPLLPRWDHGFPPARAATGASWRRIHRTAAQSAALAAAAKAAGGRVNDALVAAAIRVAAERTGGRAGAAYTVDLRRYAAAPVFSVANLSGLNVVTLSPAQLASPQAALEGVVRITGGQKSRTPGLAFTLLPLIFVGWLTHGMLHPFGRAFRALVLVQGRRLALITNVGPVDRYVAVLGDRLIDAWAVGPFMRGFPAPAAAATACGGRISVVVATAGDLDEAEVDRLAESWSNALAWIAS